MPPCEDLSPYQGYPPPWLRATTTELARGSAPDSAVAVIRLVWRSRHTGWGHDLSEMALLGGIGCSRPSSSARECCAFNQCCVRQPRQTSKGSRRKLCQL